MPPSTARVIPKARIRPQLACLSLKPPATSSTRVAVSSSISLRLRLRGESATGSTSPLAVTLPSPGGRLEGGDLFLGGADAAPLEAEVAGVNRRTTSAEEEGGWRGGASSRMPNSPPLARASCAPNRMGLTRPWRGERASGVLVLSSLAAEAETTRAANRQGAAVALEADTADGARGEGGAAQARARDLEVAAGDRAERIGGEHGVHLVLIS